MIISYVSEISLLGYIIYRIPLMLPKLRNLASEGRLLCTWYD
nr:MAG TPA: toxin [Caudoviricetes sp.]